MASTTPISRRTLLTYMGGALGTGLAAACRTPSPQAGRAPATLAPATLVFLDPDGAALGDTKEEAVAEFRTRYPAVRAERIFGEGSKTWDKLQAMIAGGSQVDVFWSWSYWKNAMAAHDLLVPFDDFLRREPRDSYTRTWSAPALESGRFKGKVYGYVTQLGVPGLHINEDLFAREGVPLPPRGYKDQSWTLDRFLDTARRLTRRNPDGTPEQFGSTPMGTWWAGMNWIIETFGGAAFNPDWTECWLDRDEAVQAIQWGADLRLTHRVAPTTAEGQGGAFDFPRGRVAMRLGWLHQPVNTIRAVGEAFRWNMYPLPRGVRQVVAGAAFNWYCLLTASKYRDQALAFIHYMASPEVVTRFLANAASFPFMGAGQESFLRDLPQLNREVALEGMALVRVQPNLPRDPEIQQVIATEVGPAFEGLRPVKEALTAAAQQIRTLMA